MLKKLPLFFLTFSIFCDPYTFLPPIHHTEKTSGLPFIDCIYVINLDRRPDRWNNMESLLKKYDLQATRVPAIDGNSFPKRYQKEITALINKSPPPNSICCFLSHINVWRDALANNFDLIWVMEDDLVFCHSPDELCGYIEILNNLDPLWDIFYTDYWEGKYLKKPPTISVHSNLNRVFSRWGTWSMIISNRGLQKLLHYVTAYKIFSPIDNEIHNIPNLRQYMPNVSIVSTGGDTKSDIQGL